MQKGGHFFSSCAYHTDVPVKQRGQKELHQIIEWLWVKDQNSKYVRAHWAGPDKENSQIERIENNDK